MKTREGTYDDAIVKEMKVYDPLFDGYEQGLVLDVGANIGAFAARAVSMFHASRVIAYEPDVDNFRLLEANTNEFSNVHCIRKAVVDQGYHTFLYVNDGMNKAIHSTVEYRGRDCYEVAAMPLKKALKMYEPELMKIDIEGGEYDFTCLKKLPSFVRGIAVELHLSRKQWREQSAPSLYKKLKRQFPNVKTTPTFGEKNWTTMFIGLR